MTTHADKTRKSQSAAGAVAPTRQGSGPAYRLADHRPQAAAQRQLRETAGNSPRLRGQQALQAMANQSDRQASAADRLAGMSGRGETRGDGAAQRGSVPGVAGYGNFVDMGNGEFGTTKVTNASEVAGLVRAIRAGSAASGEHQNIKVLTGTHGDTAGNLYGEGKFYQEDLVHEGHKKDEGGWINVLDVRGKSKDTIRGWMTPGSSAVVLAWCFSKKSEENWASVGADWGGF